MNDRQLRYFIAVAEELSFTRAAQRLNVTQPPLSTHIQALEAELGVKLLVRNRRNVRLTDAGHELLKHGRLAIDQMQWAASRARRIGLGLAGTVHLAFTSSAPLSKFFGTVLSNFASRFPDVELKLQHLPTGEQMTALLSGEIDVGILRPDSDFDVPSGIIVDELYRDQLYAFLPRAHAKASSNAPISIGDLYDDEFVTVSSNLGCGVRSQLYAMARTAGFSPRVVQEANELGTLMGLVAGGIGIAIMPDCYSTLQLPSVVYRPLVQGESTTGLMLGTLRRNANSAAGNFRLVALGTGRVTAPDSYLGLRAAGRNVVSSPSKLCAPVGDLQDRWRTLEALT